MDYLIDLLLLLYLISGLAAGAWVFYEFLFQRAFLFNEDSFTLYMSEETKQNFIAIEERLNKIEENQSLILDSLKNKQDAKN